MISTVGFVCLFGSLVCLTCRAVKHCHWQHCGEELKSLPVRVQFKALWEQQGLLWLGRVPASEGINHTFYEFFGPISNEMHLPLLYFSRLWLVLNHTESVHSLWPADVLRGRQASKAAVLVLLLINCSSVAELVLFLSFILSRAALFLLFNVTPLVSGQLWH